MTLAIILVMGIMGTAYGYWSARNLAAAANVTVGSLNASFDHAATSNDPSSPATNDPDGRGTGGTTASSWNFTTWTYNYGNRLTVNDASATVTQPSWSWTGQTGTASFNIAMSTSFLYFIYGSTYDPAAAISIKNTGTIPLKITDFENTLSNVTDYCSGYTYQGVFHKDNSITIAAGQSATFEINLEVSSIFLYSGTETVTFTAKAFNK